MDIRIPDTGIEMYLMIYILINKMYCSYCENTVFSLPKQLLNSVSMLQVSVFIILSVINHVERSGSPLKP